MLDIEDKIIDHGKAITFPKTLVITIAISIIVAVISWSVVRQISIPEIYATTEYVDSVICTAKTQHDKDINDSNYRIQQSYQSVESKIQLIVQGITNLENRLDKRLDKLDMKIDKKF